MEADSQDSRCEPCAAGAEARAAGTSQAEEGRRSDAFPSPPEAFRRLTALSAELKEYAAYFLAAKLDGAKVSLRNAVLFAGLGIIGLVALFATIATGVVLLLVGAAWGLGLLMAGQIWLGGVVVGLVVLCGLALGAYVGLRMVTGASRKKAIRKYEQRQNWERGQFGRSVREQAALQRARQ